MKMTMFLPALSAALLTVQSSVAAPAAITDADIKKLSRSEIVATVNHLGLIIEQTKDENAKLKNLLMDASTSQSIALTAAGGALTKITDLQGQIQKLADHDKAETDRANKLDKAVWWYRLHWWGAWIMLGLGVLACAVFAFLKFTGRLAIAGAKL